MKNINSVDELKGWERNSREIDKKALDGLKHSIDKFGVCLKMS